MAKNEHILLYMKKLSTPVSVVEKTYRIQKLSYTFTKTFVKRLFTKTFVCVIMKITLTIQTIRDRNPPL